MPLKIELKPNERIILGDCILTNCGARTRVQIDGKVPILREKEIMTPRRANSPAKRIYLALQLIYTSKEPRRHYIVYLQLVRDMVRAASAARPFIDRINNRILTGELYKALKEARKLVAYEEEHLNMNYANNAYAKTAREMAGPRELEANLLLKAAARLQAVHDSWRDTPAGLNEAIMYNRRLWTVLLDALMSKDNKLSTPTRENLIKLGAFVMGETFALMTKPTPDHLRSIIKINRGIAAGLRGEAA